MNGPVCSGRAAQIKKPSGLGFSPGTHPLSGEHVLSHEVFGPLEDKPTFGGLQEQDVFAGSRDGAGNKQLKLKESTWKHGHLGG